MGQGQELINSMNVNISHKYEPRSLISVRMKVGEKDLEEEGRRWVRRGRRLKETSCIMYTWPLPKMTINFMYGKHILKKTIKDLSYFGKGGCSVVSPATKSSGNIFYYC